MVYVWSLNIFMWKTTIFHDVVYPSLTETETMRRETELHNQNVHFQSQSLRFCEFMASPGQSHNFVSCSENSDCSLLMYDLQIRVAVCEPWQREREGGREGGRERVHFPAKL